MIEAVIGGRELFIPATRRTIGIESEQSPSMGIALAIVRIDPSKNGENISSPSLWTNIELKGKPETERVERQISIPSDTKKRGESIYYNMLGTLAEFSGDDNIIRGLVLMPSSYVDKAIQVKGNYYGLMVAILNRFIDVPIIPFDEDEVAPNGWIEMNELRRLQEEDPTCLRSFVGQIIGKDSISRISRVVDDFFRLSQERIPLSSVLPSDFSIGNFYKQREQLPDVIGRSGVINVSRK